MHLAGLSPVECAFTVTWYWEEVQMTLAAELYVADSDPQPNFIGPVMYSFAARINHAKNT